MRLSVLTSRLPWALRGVGPFLNRFGDWPLFGAVLRTPPIAVNPDADTGIHTALPHRYVLAYLTAIKSLLRYHADVAVYVHDDGSLGERDKALIGAHLPGARVVDRAWADRVFAEQVGDEFLQKVRTSYTSYLKLFDPTLVTTHPRIVVVDSDVLFLKRPSEIIEWITGGRGAWYHRSEPGPWGKPSREAPKGEGVSPAEVTQPTHIQELVERRLPEIGQSLGRNLALVHGFNSGFIGYERGTVDYSELRGLLAHLHGLFGERIFQWGAEQTMHGLVLCSRGARPLPTDEYQVYTFRNADRAGSAAFVHFIGQFRYHRLLYPRLAAKVIRELGRAG